MGWLRCGYGLRWADRCVGIRYGTGVVNCQSLTALSLLNPGGLILQGCQIGGDLSVSTENLLALVRIVLRYSRTIPDQACVGTTSGRTGC
jgi:hypothetical protein